MTPTLAAVTSSGRISVSVTRGSTEMDALVSVGKGCAWLFVFPHSLHANITFSGRALHPHASPSV